MVFIKEITNSFYPERQGSRSVPFDKTHDNADLFSPRMSLQLPPRGPNTSCPPGDLTIAKSQVYYFRQREKKKGGGGVGFEANAQNCK